MESVIIEDGESNDVDNVFNHHKIKQMYYAHLKAALTSNETEPDNINPRPESAEDVAMFIKVIKFGTDMNRNRTNYMKVMDVIEENDKDLLIAKRSNPYIDPILEVVPLSSSFDVIAEAHLALNHAAGEDFYSTLLKAYSMPRLWIEIFLEVCNVCSNVTSNNKNNSTFKEHEKESETPSMPKEVNVGEMFKRSAHIVEWFVFRMLENNEFQYVLCYLDLISYYVILRPLKTTSLEEITLELLKIFSDFGVPDHYICDKNPLWLEQFNCEFATEAITSMFNVKFPTPIRDKNPQESKVNILKNKIQNMLKDLNDWPVAIKNVQWQLNITDEKYDFLNSRPYYNHFGCYPINFDLDTLNEKNECPNVLCSACRQTVYKSYTCCNCNKLFHLACCNSIVAVDKPRTKSYKCKSCLKSTSKGGKIKNVLS